MRRSILSGGGSSPKLTNEAAHVQIGKTGPAHNRNIAAAATTHPGLDTTNHAEWSAALDIRELTIGAVLNTPAALDSGDAYIVVINAPDALTAKTFLEDAGSATQDIQYEFGYIGELKTISRTSAIKRIDVLPLNGVSRFFIGAV